MSACVGTVGFIFSSSLLKHQSWTLVDVHEAGVCPAECKEVLSDPSGGDGHVAQVPVKVTSTLT